ncbi:MAG: hypothetical protein ABJN40_23050 [Sneathiella sp.]
MNIPPVTNGLEENDLKETETRTQMDKKEATENSTSVDPDVADFMGLVQEDALSQEEAMLSTLVIDPETDCLLDEEEEVDE